tara:strand:- start:470 stop:1603 length:1134 start_codon:yes stop_codon:yes gene_type:complete
MSILSQPPHTNKDNGTSLKQDKQLPDNINRGMINLEFKTGVHSDIIKSELTKKLKSMGWKIESLLGIGTVGTVFKVIHNNGITAALKIQYITEEVKLHTAMNEVIMQKKMNSYKLSPIIYSNDQGLDVIPLFNTNKKQTRRSKDPLTNLYGIIMEMVGKTMDNILKRGNKVKIKDNSRQLVDILKKMYIEKLVHGDMVYFNIAINDQKKLVLIDFDRAFIFETKYSIYNIYHLLSWFRLIMEAGEIIENGGTAIYKGEDGKILQEIMDPEYTFYLRQYLIKNLLKKNLNFDIDLIKDIYQHSKIYDDIIKLFIINKKSKKMYCKLDNKKFTENNLFQIHIDDNGNMSTLIVELWEHLYNSYCRVANVLCLDGEIGKL